MPNYYFDCECGVRIPLRATQADSDLRCSCGKVSPLPSLSKLSKLPEQSVHRPALAEQPLDVLAWPARALMIVAILTIAFSALAILIDIALLASGAAAEMENPQLGIDKETQVFIRMIWAGVNLFVNVIILLGAMEMSQRKNYEFAKTAAVLAIVPCFSLCCIVGVPFGLSALSVLNRPEVRDTFT